MSKTTITLLVILLAFVGICLYEVFGIKQNPLITSFTRSLHVPTNTDANTTLSFSEAEQTIHPGQSVIIAIQLHNANPHPTLAQLEIAYDPTILTVISIEPGAFFNDPTVALQNIDPVTGRISYALHCPFGQTVQATDCVNDASSTIAVITFRVNSYAIKNVTTLSFLPKTVIRTHNGQDILNNTTKLQLPITKSLYPISSSSATINPGANLIHVTPVH
jgi:hypothetical protein